MTFLLVWSRSLSLHEWLLADPTSSLTTNYLPWHAWFFSELAGGHSLPFWNPLPVGGVPVVETMQVSLFYPPVWIYLLTEPVLASNILLIFHLWASAFAMWFLLRRVRLPESAACVGGLLYGFSGFSILQACSGEFRMVCAMPWIPLACSAFANLSSRGAISSIALGGFAGCLMVFAGNPQSTLLGLSIIICFGAASLPYSGKDAEIHLPKLQHSGNATSYPLRVFLLFLSIGGALLLLSAAQWLPLLAYAQNAVGPLDIDRQIIASNTVSPVQLLELVFPRLFSPTAAEHPRPFALGVATIGPIAFALCLVACFRFLSTKDSGTASPDEESDSAPTPNPVFPRRYFLFSLILLCLSLGSALSFRRLPYQLALSHMPRWLIPMPGDLFLVSVFAFSFLAAIGLSSLLTVPRNRLFPPASIFFQAAGVLAIVYVLLFFPSAEKGKHWQEWSSHFVAQAQKKDPAYNAPSGNGIEAFRKERFALMQHDVFKTVALLALAASGFMLAGYSLRMHRWLSVVLILLVFADLLDCALPQLQASSSASIRLSQEVARELKDLQESQWRCTLLPQGRENPNVSMYSAIRNASGFMPMMPAELSHLWQLDQDDPVSTASANPVSVIHATPYASHWSVRWCLLGQEETGRATGWTLRTETPEGALGENPEALPRIRFSSIAAEVSSSEEALLRIRETAGQSDETVYLLPDDMAIAQASGAPVAETNGTSRPTLKITKDQPNQLQLEGSFSEKGYLVVSDTWLPGWQAKVDGKASPLLRADGVMRAVSVQPGNHRIQMAYEGTLAARLGRWVSLFSFVVLSLSLIISGRYNRRRVAKAAL